MSQAEFSSGPVQWVERVVCSWLGELGESDNFVCSLVESSRISKPENSRWYLPVTADHTRGHLFLFQKFFPGWSVG